MPAITARSAKKSVSYHDLYNLSTADLLFDEKKKKRTSSVFHHKNVENVTAATSTFLETIAFIQTNIRRCCFSNVNYFDIVLTRNRSLSQRSFFQPHSKSKAWQLSTQL